MEYEQASDQRVYATFVDHDGVEAVISGTPTATIMHMQGNATIIDVGNGAMTQLSGATYYYAWNVPNSADRTTYTVEFNAVYGGVNLESTHVAAATDFQVIPRKFYDTRGGALIQRITSNKIWTKKEKDTLIDMVEALFKKTSKLQEIKSDMGLLSDKLSDMSVSLSQKAEQKDSEGIKDALESIGKELFKQQVRIEGYEPVLRELSGREGYDDINIVKKLSELSKSIGGLGQDLRNERLPLIISELGDLHKNVDDFKSAFMKSIPREIVERIKNENDEGISRN